MSVSVYLKVCSKVHKVDIGIETHLPYIVGFSVSKLYAEIYTIQSFIASQAHLYLQLSASVLSFTNQVTYLRSIYTIPVTYSPVICM